MGIVVALLAGGFAVLAALIYGVIDQISTVNQNLEMTNSLLKSMDKALEYKGTIYNQLVDIEKAINRSN